MAKLSDLPLDPNAGPGADREAKARLAHEFVAQCLELLDQPRYEFAYSTLSGMRDTAETSQMVTERMWQALENIKAGGQRHDDALRGWSRRYE